MDANIAPAAPAAGAESKDDPLPAAAASLPPPAPAAPAGDEQRLRFYVEIKPGETNIVSWKKLLKENGKLSGGESSTAALADPSYNVQPCPAVPTAGMPGNEPKDAAQPPSRFSAVIEKIERLYMGKQSSDEEEELDDIPDDDQYDTEDSFIDDTELDEYFQVDKLTTKHDGYFVNKGKLEQIETNSSSPKEAPKKRRRKDSAKYQGDAVDLAPSDGANLGNTRVKDAPRGVSLEERSLPYTDDIFAPQSDRHNEGKFVKHKANASSVMHKKKFIESTLGSENPVIPGAISNIVLSLPSERKNIDKHKPAKAVVHKVKGTNNSSDLTHQASHQKDQVEIQPKKLANGEIKVANKIGRKEKFGSGDTSALDYSMQLPQPSAEVKEGSSVRPKGTTLERAIRDLEKIVAECRPPTVDVQDADPALQGVKRRLPQEVKQKLSKVARLSASQGKISEDIVDRLMTILGHLLQRKTLKKHLKEMVELGLSAKQQKNDRFQHKKREVYDMIRARVALLKAKVTEQQDVSTDDFQESNPNDERKVLKGKGCMDAAMEDKICDLYDLYIEGMDEDKGPLCRKLYVELAELWPSGYMDNNGIKDAINRSKERKRALYGHQKVRDLEKIKRKKLASSSKVDETVQGTRVRPAEVTPAADSTGQTIVSPMVPSQSAASVGRLSDPAPSSVDFVHPGIKKADKYKGSGVCNVSDTVNKPYPEVKKKLKRKPESELGNIDPRSQKVVHETIQKQKSLRHSDDTTTIVNQQSRPTSEFPGLAVSDQPN